jgi:hypothetical protein
VLLALLGLGVLAAVRGVRSAENEMLGRVGDGIAALETPATGTSSSVAPDGLTPIAYTQTLRAAEQGSGTQLAVDDSDVDLPEDGEELERHWWDGPLDAGKRLLNGANDVRENIARYTRELGKAALHHAPELVRDVGLMAGGAGLFVAGGGGEVAGAVLTGTGIGALPGVALGVVSWGAIVAGATTFAGGAVLLSQDLSKVASEAQQGYQSSTAESRPAQPDPRASSPVKIPKEVQPEYQQKSGYEQIRYRWTDGSHKYEARWHTRTPNAPPHQGDTWVVGRRTPGTPTGQPAVQHVLTGKNEWTPMSKWQDAVQSNKAGTATPEQLNLLERGHWPAN